MICPKSPAGSRPQGLPDADQGRPAQERRLLGPLIDPDKDCQLNKDEENFKFKIEIPGKLHTLVARDHHPQEPEETAA